MYPPHVQCSDAALHAAYIGLSLSPTQAHIKLPLHRLATVKMSKRPAQFGISSASSSKKSIVWTLFDNNCIDASKVTCRLCNAAVSCGGMKKEGIGTTNLWTHLDRKHKSDAARLRQEDSSKKSTYAAVAYIPTSRVLPNATCALRRRPLPANACLARPHECSQRDAIGWRQRKQICCCLLSTTWH